VVGVFTTSPDPLPVLRWPPTSTSTSDPTGARRPDAAQAVGQPTLVEAAGDTAGDTVVNPLSDFQSCFDIG